MVPDKFNMVDMEGIDLLESQGLEIEGLYDKLVESITLCRYTILYNWKFDGVEIPPSYFELEVENNIVSIGDYVSVNSDDILHIYSIQTEANIVPISIAENGTFSPPLGTDGYAPVTVDVEPVIESLSIVENGTYTAPSGTDGYSPVTVDIEPIIVPLSVTENGTYSVPSGVDGYSPVSVDVAGGSYDPFALTDYIASSGTQYIDTGYYLNENSSVELVADIVDTNANYSIFGCSNSSGGYFYITRSLGFNAFMDVHGTLAAEMGSPSLFTGKKIVFRKSASYTTWETGIPRGYLQFTSVPTNSYSIYLFGINTAGSYVTGPPAMKLYRFRIFEYDVLVHEFIPWQDENEVVCLKDTVTDTLLYNAGSGTFTFGTDV